MPPKFRLNHIVRHWKSPRGGVNRAKLKFTNINTTTSRVSVRNINESERGRENKSQVNKEWDTRICFTEVRFSQTYSPLRWSQRPGLFQPFPLSNGHLDRVSFSSQSNGTLSPHKDHHIIGVSCLGYNWVEHKKEGRRKAIQAQELKWTQVSLSH